MPAAPTLNADLVFDCLPKALAAIIARRLRYAAGLLAASAEMGSAVLTTGRSFRLQRKGQSKHLFWRLVSVRWPPIVAPVHNCGGQQAGQLGDIGGDAPRFVAGEQVGRRASNATGNHLLGREEQKRSMDVLISRRRAQRMSPFLYRCPNTGRQVQAWAADDPTEDEDAYETVTCLACPALHLVNPKTGKVLGGEED